MSLEEMETDLNMSIPSIGRKILKIATQYDIVKYSIDHTDTINKIHDNMEADTHIDILKNPALTSYKIALEGNRNGIDNINQQLHCYVQHNVVVSESILIQLADNNDNVCVAAITYRNKNGDSLLTTQIMFIDDASDHTVAKGFIASLINFIFTINYLMINKPEILSSYTKRSTPNINKNLPPSRKTKSKKKRKTLVQKVININADSLNGFYEHGHHNITCPCWGVVGHWRTYKSGKRVWIKPHKRGRDKDKYSDNYVSKEYVTVGGIVGG